jgi:hypothetical protein
MRRLASIALLGTLALLTSNAQSQMRGGGGGGGMRSGGGGGVSAPRSAAPAGRVSSGPSFRSAPSARPSFARGSSFRAQGAPVSNFNTQRFAAQNRVFFNGNARRFRTGFFRNRFAFNNGFFGANCFGNFAFGNPFCGSVFGTGFLFGDPFFGLGYGYPGYGYAGYGYNYPGPAPDSYPQQTPYPDNSNEIALTSEIQHLSDEIDDLRDGRTRNDYQPNPDRPQASGGATLSAVPPAAYTIFILRDGRRFTAQNYAISGQTLWILNEHSARKTPLSDIDRAATEKANASNGVEIHLPEPN